MGVSELQQQLSLHKEATGIPTYVVHVQGRREAVSLLFDGRAALRVDTPSLQTRARAALEELWTLTGDVYFKTDAPFLVDPQEHDLLPGNFTATPAYAFLAKRREFMTEEESSLATELIDTFIYKVAAVWFEEAALVCLEYFIRQFAIHKFNAETLLAVALPNYSLPVFLRLAAALQLPVSSEWAFVQRAATTIIRPASEEGRAAVAKALQKQISAMTHKQAHKYVSQAEPHDVLGKKLHLSLFVDAAKRQYQIISFLASHCVKMLEIASLYSMEMLLFCHQVTSQVLEKRLNKSPEKLLQGLLPLIFYTLKRIDSMPLHQFALALLSDVFKHLPLSSNLCAAISNDLFLALRRREEEEDSVTLSAETIKGILTQNLQLLGSAIHAQLIFRQMGFKVLPANVLTCLVRYEDFFRFALKNVQLSIDEEAALVGFLMRSVVAAASRKGNSKMEILGRHLVDSSVRVLSRKAQSAACLAILDSLTQQGTTAPVSKVKKADKHVSTVNQSLLRFLEENYVGTVAECLNKIVAPLLATDEIGSTVLAALSNEISFVLKDLSSKSMVRAPEASGPVLNENSTAAAPSPLAASTMDTENTAAATTQPLISEGDAASFQSDEVGDPDITDAIDKVTRDKFSGLIDAIDSELESKQGIDCEKIVKKIYKLLSKSFIHEGIWTAAVSALTRTFTAAKDVSPESKAIKRTIELVLDQGRIMIERSLQDSDDSSDNDSDDYDLDDLSKRKSTAESCLIPLTALLRLFASLSRCRWAAATNKKEDKKALICPIVELFCRKCLTPVVRSYPAVLTASYRSFTNSLTKLLPLVLYVSPKNSVLTAAGNDVIEAAVEQVVEQAHRSRKDRKNEFALQLEGIVVTLIRTFAVIVKKTGARCLMDSIVGAIITKTAEICSDNKERVATAEAAATAAAAAMEEEWIIRSLINTVPRARSEEVLIAAENSVDTGSIYSKDGISGFAAESSYVDAMVKSVFREEGRYLLIKLFRSFLKQYGCPTLSIEDVVRSSILEDHKDDSSEPDPSLSEVLIAADDSKYSATAWMSDAIYFLDVRFPLVLERPLPAIVENVLIHLVGSIDPIWGSLRLVRKFCRTHSSVTCLRTFLQTVTSLHFAAEISALHEAELKHLTAAESSRKKKAAKRSRGTEGIGHQEFLYKSIKPCEEMEFVDIVMTEFITKIYNCLEKALFDERGFDDVANSYFEFVVTSLDYVAGLLVWKPSIFSDSIVSSWLEFIQKCLKRINSDCSLVRMAILTVTIAHNLYVLIRCLPRVSWATSYTGVVTTLIDSMLITIKDVFSGLDEGQGISEDCELLLSQQFAFLMMLVATPVSGEFLPRVEIDRLISEICTSPRIFRLLIWRQYSTPKGEKWKRITDYFNLVPCTNPFDLVQTTVSPARLTIFEAAGFFVDSFLNIYKSGDSLSLSKMRKHDDKRGLIRVPVSALWHAIYHSLTLHSTLRIRVILNTVETHCQQEFVRLLDSSKSAVADLGDSSLIIALELSLLATTIGSLETSEVTLISDNVASLLHRAMTKVCHFLGDQKLTSGSNGDFEERSVLSQIVSCGITESMFSRANYLASAADNDDEEATMVSVAVTTWINLLLSPNAAMCCSNVAAHGVGLIAAGVCVLFRAWVPHITAPSLHSFLAILFAYARGADSNANAVSPAADHRMLGGQTSSDTEIALLHSKNREAMAAWLSCTLVSIVGIDIGAIGLLPFVLEIALDLTSINQQSQKECFEVANRQTPPGINGKQEWWWFTTGSAGLQCICSCANALTASLKLNRGDPNVAVLQRNASFANTVYDSVLSGFDLFAFLGRPLYGFEYGTGKSVPTNDGAGRAGKEKSFMRLNEDTYKEGSLADAWLFHSSEALLSIVRLLAGDALELQIIMRKFWDKIEGAENEFVRYALTIALLRCWKIAGGTLLAVLTQMLRVLVQLLEDSDPKIAAASKTIVQIIEDLTGESLAVRLGRSA